MVVTGQNKHTRDGIKRKVFLCNLEFVFGVGGNKTYSSSSINSVQREWGDYKVIHAEDFVGKNTNH